LYCISDLGASELEKAKKAAFLENAVAVVPASGSSSYKLFRYLASLLSDCSPCASNSEPLRSGRAHTCHLIDIDAVQTITTFNLPRKGMQGDAAFTARVSIREAVASNRRGPTVDYASIEE
jgi:hypothetical protein